MHRCYIVCQSDTVLRRILSLKSGSYWKNGTCLPRVQGWGVLRAMLCACHLRTALQLRRCMMLTFESESNSSRKYKQSLPHLHVSPPSRLYLSRFRVFLVLVPQDQSWDCEIHSVLVFDHCSPFLGTSR